MVVAAGLVLTLLFMVPCAAHPHTAHHLGGRAAPLAVPRGQPLPPSPANQDPPTHHPQHRPRHPPLNPNVRRPRHRSDDNIRFMAVSIARLVMAKLLLLSFTPVLFDLPSQNMDRTSLLIAAIEVAEHNHNLNENEAIKHFRWQFATHSHTYCPVFLALELTKRPWSALSERAWVALQSKWLLPVKARVHRHSQGEVQGQEWGEGRCGRRPQCRR